MKEALWRVMVGVWSVVPPSLRRLLCRLSFSSLSGKGTDGNLKALIALDDELRAEIDRCAIMREGSIHPKHRLMNYHRFFVDRLKNGERVLDVGCGCGAVAFSMAQSGAMVTGIDLDEGNIRKAKERYSHPNLTFVLGDACRDVPVGKYDFVVLSNVLEHIEDRPQFLKNLAGKTGARRFLVRVPMINRDWIVPLKRELGMPYFSDPTHHAEYTRESFADEMQSAGMKINFLQVIWGEIWAEVSVV
jgi:SAM-dependent methyltransferase